MLREASARLERAGAADAEADAAWLCCEVAGVGRAQLGLMRAQDCPPDARERLEALLKRREAGEPLQYVLGWTPFCGLRLACDARALIPRPETEELAQHALHWLTRHAQTVAQVPVACLDLGAGTGALALTLAKAGYAVHAVDCSADALSLAKENAKALGLCERVTFFCGSWYHPLPKDDRYALIVSNPPYLTRADMAALQQEVRREPPLALAGGEDGLDAYRGIIAGAGERLADGGTLWLEVGATQAQAVSALLHCAGFAVQTHADMRGMPRIVEACRMPI